MIMPPTLPDIILDPIVRLALAEDLGRAGDLTTDATIAPGTQMSVEIRARKAGEARTQAEETARFDALAADGVEASGGGGGDVGKAAKGRRRGGVRGSGKSRGEEVQARGTRARRGGEL